MVVIEATKKALHHCIHVYGHVASGSQSRNSPHGVNVELACRRSEESRQPLVKIATGVHGMRLILPPSFPASNKTDSLSSLPASLLLDEL